jgi:hypothetical protein
MPQGAAGNYFASCTEFPAGLLEKEPTPALLDEVQKSTLHEMGADMVSAKDITVDGMAGREFSARKGNSGNILGRIVVGGERVYTLIGTYTSAQAPARLVEFIGSLARG